MHTELTIREGTTRTENLYLNLNLPNFLWLNLSDLTFYFSKKKNHEIIDFCNFRENGNIGSIERLRHAYEIDCTETFGDLLFFGMEFRIRWLSSVFICIDL